jgi:hypothetical protein
VDTAEQALRRVADMFAELGSPHTMTDPDTVLRALSRAASHGVDGAEFVSVTTYDGTRFATVAATHELARRADTRQFELGTGPCVVATADAGHCHVPDLDGDHRWPDFTRWACRECGLASALSVGLSRADATHRRAGLNLYSGRTGAFDEQAVQQASLLAAYGGAALAAASTAARVANLERALATNKEIGTAIGLIMARYRRSHDQAMELLRTTSQRTHRKVSDLASYVIRTGRLPGPSARRDHPDNDFHTQ